MSFKEFAPLRPRGLLAPALTGFVLTYMEIIRVIDDRFFLIAGMVIIPTYFFAFLFGLTSYAVLMKVVPWFWLRLCCAGFLGTFIPVFLAMFPWTTIPWVTDNWFGWKYDVSRVTRMALFYSYYGLLTALFAFLLSLPLRTYGSDKAEPSKL